MIKQNATQALRQLLGDRFTTSESDREIHGRSESHFDLMPPAAVAYGGTCTGEHGVGIGKKKFMEAEHGTAWEVMGTIKQALDPHNLMNPGKLVRD